MSPSHPLPAPRLGAIISADCHVTEPHDLWDLRLPPGMRERGPRVEMRDGRACFVVEGQVVRKLPPLPSRAGGVYSGPETFS